MTGLRSSHCCGVLAPPVTPPWSATVQTRCLLKLLREEASSSLMYAAVVAAGECPCPASDRVAVMADVMAPTAVAVFVLGAGHDRAVGVDDERARAGLHVRDGSEVVGRAR